MHPDTRHIAQHMREFGLAILGRAVYDLTFSEYTQPYKHPMAVGLAAQGAEISIKARIAEEHPLLLFAQLPKSASTDGQLTVGELFEYGRTIQFAELPEMLWATTGIRLGRPEQLQRFGKLRNMVIHFAAPAELEDVAMRFLFEIMEPLVQSFWGESLVPYAGTWDEYLYRQDGLEARLAQAGIEITPDIRAALDEHRN